MGNIKVYNFHRYFITLKYMSFMFDRQRRMSKLMDLVRIVKLIYVLATLNRFKHFKFSHILKIFHTF